MIPLTDKYYITAEKSNYILCEKIIVKDSETGEDKRDPETGEIIESRRAIGYYSTIACLLRGFKSYILRKKIAECQLTTMDELIAEVQRLVDEENKLLSSLEV